MKTKRILITLSLGYGINMMGFESSLTREQISVSNPELTVLSLREFCMLSKENLLRMDDMTPDKVAAIERLLAEYSLRLGMSDVELEAYLNRYYEENPKEKEFYDMCDRLCNSKPVFDENRFREELFRELNSSPMSEKRLSDLGWLRYQTVRETYLNQPFFLRWSAPKKPGSKGPSRILPSYMICSADLSRRIVSNLNGGISITRNRNT